MKREREERRENERRKKRDKKKKRKERKRKRKRGRRSAVSSSVHWRFHGRNSLDQGVKSRDSSRGYDSRGRDSSYLGFFLSFELLFLSAFRTMLCHVYGMFYGINWNMAHFAVSIETGCSRSKGLLPKQIWVENLQVRELPKCSCNARAHYCVDWCNSVALVALQLRMIISFSSEL